MLSSLLRSALVLAAVCCLSYAESFITCEDQLSCDKGWISVLKVAYGWTDIETCKEDNPTEQLANTAGALEALANRCNGTKVCEVDKTIFGADPCPDTYKYIQTTYTCLAYHVVACEDSEVELLCDSGQTIALIGAFYGRADQTTCKQHVPFRKLKNIDCSAPNATQFVAERCKGESCTFLAKNNMFGKDPCQGTYKYLEVDYTCEYPS